MTNIPLWAQIVIAFIGSGIVGSVASIILSPILARQEIRKLEVSYRQKLNDNLLQNTRQHIDPLYIPINKSLSRLEDSYQTYKRRKAFLRSIRSGRVTVSPQRSPDEASAKTQSIIPACRDATKEALEQLHQTFGAFKTLMGEITEQSREIYLTSEFDERLRSFAQFLKAVNDEGWLIASTGKDIEEALRIDAKGFEKRFFDDMRYLKSYIKEITLGTTEVRKKPS